MSLKKRWDERQKESVLQRATSDVFGSPHDLSNLDNPQRFETLKEKLEALISALPESHSQLFDSLTATPGFMNWNDFFMTRSLPINIVWRQWITHLSADSKENYEMFIDLFQNVQIRVMSEAICETTGSMMVTHGAKGRYLQPNNFSNELYLRFNLGPLHLLDDLCDEVLNARQKEYIRTSDH